MQPGCRSFHPRRCARRLLGEFQSVTLRHGTDYPPSTLAAVQPDASIGEKEDPRRHVIAIALRPPDSRFRRPLQPAIFGDGRSDRVRDRQRPRGTFIIHAKAPASVQNRHHFGRHHPVLTRAPFGGRKPDASLRPPRDAVGRERAEDSRRRVSIIDRSGGRSCARKNLRRVETVAATWQGDGSRTDCTTEARSHSGVRPGGFGFGLRGVVGRRVHHPRRVIDPGYARIRHHGLHLRAAFKSLGEIDHREFLKTGLTPCAICLRSPATPNQRGKVVG